MRNDRKRGMTTSKWQESRNFFQQKSKNVETGLATLGIFGSQGRRDGIPIYQYESIFKIRLL